MNGVGATERARRHLRAVGDREFTTTHEQRAQWLSERIRKYSPAQPEYLIISELFLLSLERDKVES